MDRTYHVDHAASTTPGMLYFKDGTDGHLKFRTGTNYGILGNNDGVTLGRLLANHDGSWPVGDTDDPLTFANKAVIQLEGTSRIMGTYLEIKLFCTQPTNTFVETYGQHNLHRPVHRYKYYHWYYHVYCALHQKGLPL